MSRKSSSSRFSTELLLPLQTLTTDELELSTIITRYSEQLRDARNNGQHVNFAEAALNVQDWTSEYSRSVDALFISVLDVQALLVSCDHNVNNTNNLSNGNSTNEQVSNSSNVQPTSGTHNNSLNNSLSSASKRMSLSRRRFASGSRFEERIRLDKASSKCIVESIKKTPLKTISITPAILADIGGHSSDERQQVMLYSLTESVYDKSAKPEVLGTKNELKCCGQFKYSTVCVDNALTIEDESIVILTTSFNFDEDEEDDDNLSLLESCSDSHVIEDLEDSIPGPCDASEAILSSPTANSAKKPSKSRSPKSGKRQSKDSREQPKRSCRRNLEKDFAEEAKAPLENAWQPVVPSDIEANDKSEKKEVSKRKKKTSNANSKKGCKRDKKSSSSNKAMPNNAAEDSATPSTSTNILIDAKDAAQAIAEKKLELEQQQKEGERNDTSTSTVINNNDNGDCNDHFDNSINVEEEENFNETEEIPSTIIDRRSPLSMPLQTDSTLSERVGAWHSLVRPRLQLAQNRAMFDNEHYCSQVLSQFPRDVEGATDDCDTVEFEAIVSHREREEVCRLFLSSLFLANKGNVEILDEDGDEVARIDPSDKSKACDKFSMDQVKLRLLQPQFTFESSNITRYIQQEESRGSEQDTRHVAGRSKGKRRKVVKKINRAQERSNDNTHNIAQASNDDG